jgi:MEMO1 family protein
MIREPAVAGSFYPSDPVVLRDLVAGLLDPAGRPLPGEADRAPEAIPAGSRCGLLVPHAGLEWSGGVAATGWRWLADAVRDHGTVVVLGTNHSAWLEGVGIWPEGAWRTPLGEVRVDDEVGRAIGDLGPPFHERPGAHLREHSIEVQLPLLRAVAPDVRIVPLAVSTGTGPAAVDAGERLGRLVAALDRPGRRVVLAISTDLAHYPSHRDAVRVTGTLLPSILGLDPVAIAATERRLVEERIPALACGMCGIEPTVVGLAALRAAGATRATRLAAATSADAGGPTGRTVGYLSVGFAGPPA